jgi:HEAT repeat protein
MQRLLISEWREKLGLHALGVWLLGCLGLSFFSALFGCDFPQGQETYDEPLPAVEVEAPPAPPKPPVTTQFTSVDEGLKALVVAIDARQKEQQQAAYGWLGKQGEAAVPAVIALMNDGSASMEARRAACHVLGQLGPAGVPALLEASSSEEVPLKLKAIESLGSVRPSQTPIVDRLIELIDDSQQQVRVTAIRSLGFIGPPAKRSGDRLIAIRDGETNETLRSEAARALELVRPIRTFED